LTIVSEIFKYIPKYIHGNFCQKFQPTAIVYKNQLSGSITLYLNCWAKNKHGYTFIPNGEINWQAEETKNINKYQIFSSLGCLSVIVQMKLLRNDF